MTERTLGPWNVAILLISASYGIGFVFGTGELARTIGMASSLYAAATGIGMVFLAAVAGTFWRLGAPVWGLFREKHRALEAGVALLSSVWLLGIFSVQLQGAAAVLGLNFGLAPAWQHTIAGALVWLLGRLRPGRMGAVFTVFLAAASASLVVVIVLNGGIGLYARSWAMVATDAARYLSPTDIGVTVVSTIALVILGADYQQFVILARSRQAAVMGCVLAGVAVMLISTLPSTAVLAAMQSGHLAPALAAKETIPFLVVEPFGGRHGAIGQGILCVLLLAALGSGAAVAMAAAHATRQALSWKRVPDSVVSLAVVLGGIAIAQIGTSMVGLIVSINTLFLTTVAVPLAATLVGYGSGRGCAWAMAAGFTSALAALCLQPLLGWHAGAWLSAAAGIACGGMVLAGVTLYESRRAITSIA
ncbi:hypothetical protein [Ralstonia sp. UBA689]|uniref:hypothetical protein n=1 Tax=Ralstonia sp. UBA689 TaxID=1947373 RepID=UPI0025D7271D|nr:hypothetical protein [Ralstonia sp. UBA689]